MSKEDLYALLVCCLVFLALGFAGWYENYNPAQFEMECGKGIKTCDRR